MDKLCVLVDHRESGIYDALEFFLAKELNATDKMKIYSGSLDIADMLICEMVDVAIFAQDFEDVASRNSGAGSKRKNDNDADTSASAGNAPAQVVYNPIFTHFSQSASTRGARMATDGITAASTVLVPMIVIERKEAADLGQSITGKNPKPGFVRFKDQKIRMRSFQAVTGCMNMLIVEGYDQYKNSVSIGGLPEDSFKSAVVHSMVRDKIFVDYTFNSIDTARVVRKIAKEIVDKSFRNFMFEQFYKACRGHDPEEFQDICTGISMTREKMYDGVAGTEKLISNHHQLVSVRKKDNKDPKMCFRMMLTCVHGVSEKAASAILENYDNMHDLIKAYRKCESSKEREQLLKDIELASFTPRGKRRKIGPAKSKDIYETLYGIEKKEKE